MSNPMTRRTFVRRTSGLLLATATGGVLAARPDRALAAGCPYGCGMPFGPQHRYLWQTGVAPEYQHGIIARESGWNAAAVNPSSGAAGLCQYLPWIWDWLVESGIAAGSPYDGFAAISAMNNCLNAGYSWMWDCGPYDC